ncbi:hypothetical protein F5144DRAFT_561199 [Chaetomium tenue]|uniref:Uncharacterized protein n=1 Tax=Chaetomium tenue TaxID=1854479 RepID=A0ACB7PFQ8_9PEZI|nr:hypothetical protein F5144DRAFT_561199 [Chaetomium globosum]
MSGLEILGAVTAVLGEIESAIALAARFRTAYQRQQGLTHILKQHGQILVETQRIVTLVKEEEALQTAAVTSELITVDASVKGLVNLLTRIQTSGQRKRSGRFSQILYQLVHGSRDEGDLRSAMVSLGRAKHDLGLCISVAHVGLSRGMQDTLVLNTRLLERVDTAVRSVVGDDQGLAIGKLARSRPVQDNGTLVITADDLASIEPPSRARGRRPSPLTANGDESTAQLIVSENMTADQALQINGPVGMQEWYSASHLIQGNKASAKSVQINGAMSPDAFTMLLQARV